MPRILICTILMAVTLLFQGCAGKQQIPSLEQGASLAVAGFEQPQQNWQLLAGYLPEPSKMPDKQVFKDLNSWLMQEIEGSWDGQIASPLLTNQCKEIVLFEQKGRNFSALKFWTLVGRCVPAKYLLVPQLFTWREREGGEWGVKEPAKVVLDLYLIDIEGKKILKRFHYEEEQQSLSANVFDIKSFFKRKARWVKAERLAKDAIAQGVKELGL
jgi:hypothetical protein